MDDHAELKMSQLVVKSGLSTVPDGGEAGEFIAWERACLGMT